MDVNHLWELRESEACVQLWIYYCIYYNFLSFGSLNVSPLFVWPILHMQVNELNTATQDLSNTDSHTN